jgi:hypothetical protein
MIFRIAAGHWHERPRRRSLGSVLRRKLEYGAGGVVAYLGVLVVHADSLERGRESYARRAWSDAYDSLSRADQAASLGGEDLELFAKSAYMRGSKISFVNADAGACRDRTGRGKPASPRRKIGLTMSSLSSSSKAAA